MANLHVPVMLTEVIKYLRPKEGDNFIDGTFGGGGYTLEFLKMVGASGGVLAVDLDDRAIDSFKTNIGKIPDNLILVKGNFAEIKNIYHDYQRIFNKIDGIVLDLGLSSNQLEDRERGFSFQGKGFLDMRFDEAAGLTASEVINGYSTEELTDLFKRLGEERLAKPIAVAIVEERREEDIVDPEKLANIISEVYRRYFRGKSRLHPATKVFQALRMVVNNELYNLSKFLPEALEILAPGARLAVVSFHSLEDRIVKNFFRTEAKGCICSAETLVCDCGHKPRLKIITKKPLLPGVSEINKNPRCRSAKLRVAEKI